MAALLFREWESGVEIIRLYYYFSILPLCKTPTQISIQLAVLRLTDDDDKVQTLLSQISATRTD